MSMMPFKARLFPDHLVSDLSKIVHTPNVILQRRTKRNIIFYGFSLLWHQLSAAATIGHESSRTK